MKTKIKSLIILIAIFALSLVAGIAAGCSIGEKKPYQQAEERGLICPVTYYANGGKIGDKSYCTICYKPGTPIYEISGNSEDMVISRSGYVFIGWEYCRLDSEGKPILKDENGNVLNVLENGTADIKGANGRQLAESDKVFTAEASGESVFTNGAVTIQDGEHIYLAATWVKDVVVEYRLVTDTPISIKDEADAEVTIKTGDLIAENSFGTYDTKQLTPEKAPVQYDTHSYVQMYYDLECTKPVKKNDSAIQKPTDGKNVIIYAKYLEGKWETLREASNVSTMFSNIVATNYYLPFDIDCAGQSFSLQRGTFNHRIEGNGFTLSNLAIGESSAQQLTNASTVSLFGRLGAKAQINNLKIENVTAKVSIRNSYNVTVSALFSGYNQGAQITGLSVKGYELNIDLGGEEALILNIQKDNTGNYLTDKWLYSTSLDSDADFIAEFGDQIELEDATLIINNKQVTGGQQ